MRINKISTIAIKKYKNNYTLRSNYTKLMNKVQTVSKKFDNRAGFMSKPLKYLAIGLVIPFPLASAVGFVVGLGVAISQQISNTLKK